MKGERQLVRAGYAWHVFAQFPCNVSGVRVAVRKTPRGAEHFAKMFAKRNNVETSWALRRLR